ncbi:general stress protein [Streptomyces sp. NPDC001222]|uniref:general stress protein n=1 Tax=Streptomyces sp. NPDC001222 TaxID=3364548 RepID=UPI0036B348ED
MNEQASRTIASCLSRQEAEHAVDRLSDQGFPVERVAPIGQDLRLIAQVIGQMGYGRAALQGAASGAVPEVLIGWFFGSPNWPNPAASGPRRRVRADLRSGRRRLLRLLLLAAQGGRRKFASVPSMQPSRYVLVTDEDVTEEVARLLVGPLRSVGARTQSGAWRSGRPHDGPAPT